MFKDQEVKESMTNLSKCRLSVAKAELERGNWI